MNRRSFLFKTALATLSISAVAAGFALAQGLPTSIGGLILSTSVDHPTPGQNVTITAASYAFDINSANITWTAGGKTLGKGVGVTTITVQAPVLGKHLVVNATAVSADGTVANSSYTVDSGYVDLIIEPDGYVPPLFSGKIPVAYQNTVKIVAIPHMANSSGVEYDPKTLVYSWQDGTTVLTDQSGYGKQSVIIPGSLVPRPYIATVIVTSRDGSLQTQGSISVEANAPSVSFYRNDPLYGPLFNNALGGSVYIGSQREVGVLAVPYGFNMPAPGTDGLSFVWSINGMSHSELDGHQSVTLRAPNGVAGSSNVQLRVTGTQAILQQATAGFSAAFTNAASSTSSTITP